MVRRSLSAACAVVSLYAGCNPVLGIEPAEYDPSLESPCADPTPAAPPPEQCVGSESLCQDCLSLQSTCRAQYEQCKADADCRMELFDYLDNCLELPLGVNCNAERADCCASRFGRRNTLAVELRECAFDRCRSECRGAPLGNRCLWFCQCMPQTCPETFEQGVAGGAAGPLSTYPGDTAEAKCFAYCNDLADEPEKSCRLRHCDYAAIVESDDPERPQHCGHAAGTIDCGE